MQTLVVYQKSDRKLIAAFNLKNVVTEMDVLTVPGIGYLMTFKNDIYYQKADGKYYVKDNI